ncbi:hypothetical protein [Aestuariibaculum sediminum]|uniref:Uncharacterized protein n=1 Tax=Aestuariibaculum sediminum TaxID=2770637 RepID=A0A8J6Q0Z0_9FLAO|nr:hypothetical protein [Aestuariibaculum sediminum]MBD0833648.1 hypothetical protein [Aestuariibaculum sediminum]
MINFNKILKLSVTFIIVLSFSCKDKLHDKILEKQQMLQDSINKTPEGKASKIENNNFDVITFEGCEYLIYKEQPSNNKAMGFMAHKGNCTNPIHNTTSNYNP